MVCLVEGGRLDGIFWATKISITNSGTTVVINGPRLKRALILYNKLPQ
jgi:hypothetical protein